jgi:hypothetical protein
METMILSEEQRNRMTYLSGLMREAEERRHLFGHLNEQYYRDYFEALTPFIRELSELKQKAGGRVFGKRRPKGVKQEVAVFSEVKEPTPEPEWDGLPF